MIDIIIAIVMIFIGVLIVWKLVYNSFTKDDKEVYEKNKTISQKRFEENYKK